MFISPKSRCRQAHKHSNMGGNARRRRKEVLRDSTKSGAEILDEKLARIQYESAHVSVRWIEGMSNLSFFIIIYAIFHIYKDSLEYIDAMEHDWELWHVLDILAHIGVHFFTIVNALFIKKYLKSVEKDKKSLYYSIMMSMAEILFIMHSFPMGTFYLLVSMAILHFVEYQNKQVAQNIDDIRNPKFD